MMVVFIIPLIMIAFFESYLDTSRNVFMRQMFTAAQDGEEEDPENRDPEVEGEDGMRISKKSFDEIVKAFPNSFLVSFGSSSRRFDIEWSNVVDRGDDCERASFAEASDGGAIPEAGDQAVDEGVIASSGGTSGKV